MNAFIWGLGTERKFNIHAAELLFSIQNPQPLEQNLVLLRCLKNIVERAPGLPPYILARIPECLWKTMLVELTPTQLDDIVMFNQEQSNQAFGLLKKD